jgi:uncharacterized protein (DUF486 family)
MRGAMPLGKSAFHIETWRCAAILNILAAARRILRPVRQAARQVTPVGATFSRFSAKPSPRAAFLQIASLSIKKAPAAAAPRPDPLVPRYRLTTAQGFAMTTLAPIVLLFCSNVFMTFAWYGQLKFPNVALWQVVLISWGIAFFEYCLAVPANRIGHQVYSAAQLKTLQEIITLLVFGVFSVTYLGESLKWNNMVAFGFLCCAAFFSFHKWT